MRYDTRVDLKGVASPGAPEAVAPRVVPTRRRGASLEEAILGAAWDVLLQRGYGGFTYEAIAAQAGTSRPVLYRRWPQRHDLLLATVARAWASPPIVVPDTGSLREDAIGLLRNADIGRRRMLTLIGAQLMDYFRDSGTSFSELRESLREPGQQDPFEQIVSRAVARGELASVVRSPRVIGLPFDLYRHEVFMTMRAVPDETLIEIVDELWLPLLHQSSK